MLTTLDRHLLARFLHAFFVFFVAALGLYVVVDGFTNLDGFQRQSQGQGVSVLLWNMGRHYLYHSSYLLNVVGPTIAAIAALTVLALIVKHGELNSVLAAGIPTYRLSVPFVLGMVLVNGLLIANQEFIIPRISVHLQGSHGHTAKDGRLVEPYLTADGIFISGAVLFPADRRISQAEFKISPGRLASDFISLRSETAYYLTAQGEYPAGWLLKNVQPKYESLHLTDAGRKIFISQQNSDDLFLVCDVSFDQLYNRGGSYKFLSTKDLLTRINQPSSGTSSSRSQIVYLHRRLTRPVLSILGVLLIIPIMIRRDRTSLVSSIALSMFMLGAAFGFVQAVLFVGQAGLIQPALAAWSPLIGLTGLAAWLSPNVLT